MSRFFKNADAAGLTINSKSLLDCLLSLPARYLRRTLVSMPKVDTRGLQIERLGHDVLGRRGECGSAGVRECGFRIEFPEAVRVTVALGYWGHFGMGLFDALVDRAFRYPETFQFS